MKGFLTRLSLSSQKSVSQRVESHYFYKMLVIYPFPDPKKEESRLGCNKDIIDVSEKKL